jgi:outer membrane protein assembly factor BamB
VDGERVYTLFWDGTNVALYAYDFRGEFVWKYDLGSFTSQHGPGASPVVYDGLVYLNNDQDKFKDNKEQQSGFPGRTSKLIALDAKTGKPVWQAPRTTYRACYSTPFINQRPDGTVELIVASTAGITGYDPKTGADKWNWTWHFRKAPLRTVGSPILAHGIVFIGSGDGSGERHMVAVRKGDKGDVSTSNLVWQTRKAMAPYVPSLLSWGEHVYFVGDKGTIGCLDAKTGEAVWTKELHGGDMSASPVLIDGKIYAVSDDGDVFVYRAAPKFELLAKNALGEDTRATPAVANGKLFLRGQKHLFCIGRAAK